MTTLLDRSGLSCDVSVLSRKLSGSVALRTNECEALAEALGVEVSAGRRCRRGPPIDTQRHQMRKAK